MRSKKYLIIIMICVLGCMLFMTGCGESVSKKDKEPKSKTVTITDSAGRNVELPQPLEKTVIMNTCALESMRILKVHDTVIGVVDTIHDHPYLGMQDKDLVGTTNQPSFEKIVELKPQVVITYASGGSEVADKLEPTGIKVVLLNLSRPEVYDSEFITLAKMYGKVKEATVFLKWKAEQIAALDKTKDIKPEQRVKVLTMTTNSVETEKWSVSKGGSAMHQAIEMAGGINLGGELTETVVSPEWILQQNPGVLFFREGVSGLDTNLVGYKINDLKNAEKFIEKAKINKVLSKTGAVQKDQTYVIAADIVGYNKSYLGAFYLAKWFYPDLFKDLDPDKILKEYFEKWLDIPFQGKWAYPPASK
jgi:iron complex transport system substrate-binding protein